MNLQENIKRVLKEESEIPNHIRRRYNQIVNVLDVVLSDSYVCDADNVQHFIEGIFFNMSEYLYGQTIEGLDVYGVMEFVEDNLVDDIIEYYNDHVGFCLKEVNESIEVPKIFRAIQKSIDENGFFTTISIFGKDEVISRLDKLNITRKDKLKLIKEVCEQSMYGGFGFGEIEEEPIFYSENENEYKEIAYIGPNHCYLDVWSKPDSNHEGEIRLMYHNLDDYYIDRIFKVCLDVGMENKFI
jgi:hypothetical protein